MEQLRWPKGGLNVDDSVELLNEDDYTYARNIASGRTFNGKRGEKEVVRGTAALEDLLIYTDIEENNSFGTWLDSGDGVAWSIDATPSVLLNDGSATSKVLGYTFAAATTGVINVAFNLTTTVSDSREFTVYCAIKNGSTVLETKSVVNPAVSGRITFAFDSDTDVDNVAVWIVMEEFGDTPQNLNTLGNNGNFETEMSTWGMGGIATHSRSSLYKESGTYSMKFKANSGLNGGFAVARLNNPTVGKTYRVRARVYSPSSSPMMGVSHGYQLFIEGFAIWWPVFTVDDITVVGTSSAINTWSTIETVITITDNPFNSSMDFLIKVRSAIGPGYSTNVTIGIGDELYVDEFYIFEDEPTERQFELATPSIVRQVSSEILDENSQLIGTIRSASNDTNYLFFYNTDTSKNCIVKLQDFSISLVLQWSGLNFSPLKDYRVTSGGLTDELIYFTDNYNPPRVVHLTRYAGGAVPNSEEEIALIRRGPAYAPNYSTFSIMDNPPIDLSGEYQFALQYEYQDGQLSVISPWSAVVKKLASPFFYVGLTTPTQEVVPPLVKKVRYIVRNGNNGVARVFNTLNTPLDPNENALFLDGNGFTTYYGEESGPILETIYNKPFENIPFKAGTMAISKSRLWLGNYIEGYDTPDAADYDVNFQWVEQGTENDSAATWASNSKYRAGIVFYDSYGRSCGVVDGDWVLEFPPLLYRAGVNVGYNLKYNIEGIAPSWATHYALVLSKDQIKSYFIEGSIRNDDAITGGGIYVTESADGTTETYNDTYETTAKYIRIGLAELNKSGIYYSIQEGDLCIIANASGTHTRPLKIKKMVGDYVYMESVSISNTSWLSFQIYRPAVVQDDLYYEMGEKWAVKSDRTLDATFVSMSRATQGSAFKRVINSRPSAQMNATGSTTWNQNIGKAFITLDVGEITKKAFFKCSSPYIAGANVNGLSEFNIGDESNVSFESGQIRKLQPTTKESTEGDILLAICDNATYSVYIDEAKMSTNDGSAFLIASPQVIGDVRKQQAGYGTQHPESVHEENGYVYWYDKLNRAFVRYATNGVYPISEYKVVDYFEDQSALNTENDIVLTSYDPFYKMIIVTFANADTDTKKTIGYSVADERWISFYDFAPQGYAVGSNKLYSFFDGEIYSHTNTDNFNEFFGFNNESEITVSFNDEPSEPKEWKVLQPQLSSNFFDYTAGNQMLTANLIAEISNRHEQETSILAGEWEVDENMVYGEIRGDENSEGGVLNGDPIYSNTLQVNFKFNGGPYKQLLMVKAGCEISRGHLI